VIGLTLFAAAQGLVLYKPELRDTWRPPIERFIQAVKAGQGVNDADFVKPIGPQGATLLKPLSACKPKGYDTTFQKGEVMVRWHCKGRAGTDLISTLLEFEGDKIRRVGLHEVDEYVRQR
jgi:hypothetical protein